jgi:hypothetical protein
MTLTIEISPELQRRLQEEASLRGLSADDYARMVLEGKLTTQHTVPKNGDAWAVLESMKGTVEGPADLASELDHYLYGTPKRVESSE